MNLRSVIAPVALGLGLIACGGGGDSSNPQGGRSGSVDLTGAGSTFLAPLVSRWSADYNAATGVRINYGSLGSGAGIRQFSEQTVDFGATDGPMTEEELAGARGGSVIHVPVAIGAVVLGYNLEGVAQPLVLSGDVVADIFLGRITKWNDPRLAALNPGVALPADDIVVVHRTDGSGTTYVFTDYLSAVSPAWASGPGRGKQINWPTGLGGKGNEGVAGQVKQTPAAIGYMELAYAKQNNLSTAAVVNAAGTPVQASVESMSAAAEGVLTSLPPDTDFRVSIVNSPAPDAYPITSLTWVLAYEQQADSAKGRKLVDFLRWSLNDGDAQAAALDYAPLPQPLEERVLQRLDSIRLGSGQ